eukprot:CAMPEP_0197580974 /NCGR_PEP_ID=MMETSP1326-20131121/4640_1 /TAXON_ID=1155430 /ORGANISM="Genus nov. species nov., Strain RCC2288" /LENGTH=121 /DNA_ID=CAMNT_0043144813 /DNA_START=57 /DNA_END=419 /DNA_ORIENTATION=-
MRSTQSADLGGFLAAGIRAALAPAVSVTEAATHVAFLAAGVRAALASAVANAQAAALVAFLAARNRAMLSIPFGGLGALGDDCDNNLLLRRCVVVRVVPISVAVLRLGGGVLPLLLPTPLL